MGIDYSLFQDYLGSIFQLEAWNRCSAAQVHVLVPRYVLGCLGSQRLSSWRLPINTSISAPNLVVLLSSSSNIEVPSHAGAPFHISTQAHLGTQTGNFEGYIFYLTWKQASQLQAALKMKDEESMNDIEPHDEHTLLNYLKWQPKFYEEKPYEVLSQVPEGLDQANFTLESGQPQVIHDLRGQEDDFNMDDNGFAIIHQDIPHCNFDTESIEKIYLPSIHDLLQEIDPGCESFIFDWKVWPKSSH